LSEFEELLEKIQEQKPELTKQDIEDRIKQKKEKIGRHRLFDRSGSSFSYCVRSRNIIKADFES
jgi:hypothetical protein